MRRAVIITGMALALFSAAPDARAEKFTSAEFLKWPQKSREAYFHNSITMTGIIAAQIDKEIARCIDAWSAEQDRTGHPVLMDAVKSYSDYHPQAIVLWVLQRECGKLSPDR